MLLSIVIPAFNEEKYILQTLKRIISAFEANSSDRFSWEIIVCDNNSTDRTAEIAAQLGAIVVKEPINQISRARNTGAKIAKGEWLLFIDADSFPPPLLITDVLNAINSGKLIGCGATVTVKDGTLWNKLRIERLNPFMRFFKWCGGAFIVCEGQAFRHIGGFSSGLFAYEEIDFVIRLRRYGRSIGKQFTVLHQHPVVTSGRRGEYNLKTWFTIIFSNISAIILLIMHYIIPEKHLPKNRFKLLKHWYKTNR